MNPLLQQALGAIVRAILTGAAGYFVRHGIWTATDAETYIGAAALFVLSVGWSIWQKYGALARQKTLEEINALLHERHPMGD